MKQLFSTSYSQSALHIWLLILRIGVASLMLVHGLPKISKLFSDDIQFADPLGIGMLASLALAAFAEVVCSILILFGAATRLATIPLIITMSVAAFIVHQHDPFSKKEVPLLYLLIFINILILGSGKYGIDHKIQKSWKVMEK